MYIIKVHVRKHLLTFLLTVMAALKCSATVSADVPASSAFHQWCSRQTTAELTRLGTHYLKETGQPDSAIVCYSIVVARYAGQTPPQAVRENCVLSLFNIGYIYMFHYYDYRKAYAYMLRSEELGEQFGSRYLPYIYLGLANLEIEQQANNQGDVNGMEAVKKFRKAMDAAAGQEAWDLLSGAFCALVSLVMENDSVQVAVPDVARYRSMNVPDTVPMARYTSLLCDAIDHLLANDHAAAYAALDQAVAHIDRENIQAARFELMARYYQVRLLAADGHYDKALPMLREQIARSRELEMWDSMLLRQRALVELLKKSGQEETARMEELSYLQQSDSFELLSQVGSMGEERFLLDLEKSNEHMLHIEQQRRMNLTLAVAAVVVALLLGLLVWIVWRKNRMLRRKNEQLYRKTEQLLRHPVSEPAVTIVAASEPVAAPTAVSEPSADESEQKYQRSRLSATDKAQLVKRIGAVMEQTVEICQNDFSLQRLAELTNESKERVSQVINECYGKNFNQLLAEYRIREACRRLTDSEHYGGYTIEAIGESLGYRSRSNFAAVFRRETGLQPSEYQRIARQRSV
jgi:AraC-like DNA-binding protein